MIDAVPMDLPFDQAIAWFRSKGIEISASSWRDVWREANARAFTVARVTDADVLRDIKSAVDKALADGTTLRDFQREIVPTLEQKGWWTPSGEKAVVQLPDGTEMKRLTPWRLDTIFNTNLQTAYSTGRYEQQMRVAEQRPLWQYKAVMDAVTRPDHAEQNDQVYDFRHPFWDQWYPPNGFNCFPGGTPVLTSSGWAAIETVSRQDRVVGGSGQEQTVSAVHRNMFHGDMIRLVLEDVVINATPNHRILTMIGWMRADRVKPGDILVQTNKATAMDSLVGNVNRTNAREDLRNGAPLDMFNSLDDFRTWARSHCALNPVRSVQKEPYTGNVFNLTVDTDTSFIVRGATVHNCRCYVVTLSEEEAQERGLEEQTRGASGSPDEGWDYNVGKEGLAAWQPDLEKYEYPLASQVVERAVESPQFEEFFEGRIKGNFPVAYLEDALKEAIDARYGTIWLSDQTLAKNLGNHPELGFADYQAIPRIIDQAQLVVQDGDNTLVFFRSGEQIYFAAVKSTASGETNFLTSLRLARMSDVEAVRRKGRVIRDEL